MGEVRKRKASGEKSAAAEKPIVSSGGGLGLIPVVLIAAVLAGSGCFVIKKDHAENFANIQTLTDQLRADNVKTIKTVDAMKKSIEQKDSIIKELQSKVTAGNEKNRLTDEKLQEIIKTVTDSSTAAGDRQSQIDILEVALQQTIDTSTGRTDELKKLIEDSAADTGALEIQTAQLNEVTGQIDQLNTKIQEGATKIAQLNAETVAINAKIEIVETAAQSADKAIHEITTIGGAQLEELKTTIPEFQAQIDAFAETIDEIASTIPSQTLLVTLQTTTKKAADGLAVALKDISANSQELRSIKADAEKELSGLASQIGSVVDSVKQGDSVVATLNDSVDTANTIIGALSTDIDALKKRYSELTKKISAK